MPLGAVVGRLPGRRLPGRRALRCALELDCVGRPGGGAGVRGTQLPCVAITSMFWRCSRPTVRGVCMSGNLEKRGGIGWEGGREGGRGRANSVDDCRTNTQRGEQGCQICVCHTALTRVGIVPSVQTWQVDSWRRAGRRCPAPPRRLPPVIRSHTRVWQCRSALGIGAD